MSYSLKSILLVLAIAGTSCLTSCGKYNHTDDLTLEEQSRRPRVYGDADGPARQLQNQYEADPELAQKADAARQKLFGADYIFVQTGNPVNDTMSISSAPPLRDGDDEQGREDEEQKQATDY